MDGRVLGLLVVTSALYGLVVTVFKLGSESIPPFASMAISMFVLFLLSLGLSLLLERDIDWGASGYRKDIVVLVVGGALNAAAFWCLLKSFRYVPVWQSQMFGLLNPIFAALFAYALLGEAVSGKMFLGLVFVSVGLFISVR